MAEPADINVDELRRRARRRLVGAVVLALGVAVVVPMLLETEQKPLGEDVTVKIPPVDDGKFVNRLNGPASTKDTPGGVKSPPPVADAARSGVPGAPAAAPATAERPSKYDTHVAAPAPASTSNPSPSAEEPRAGAAKSPETPSASRAPPAPSPDSTRATKSSVADTGKPVTITEIKPPPSGEATTVAKSASSASTIVAHDGFAVQLAAFADDKGANTLASRLKKAGYAAYTEPLKTSKGTLWRVRVGPYPSREAALAARDRLKIEGQSGIVAAIK
jgi:Uncharacterized protein conserved in bacteria